MEVHQARARRLQLESAHAFRHPDPGAGAAHDQRAGGLQGRDRPGQLDLESLHRQQLRSSGQGQRLGADPGGRLAHVRAEQVAGRRPGQGQPADLGVEGEVRPGHLGRRHHPVEGGHAVPGQHRPGPGRGGRVRRVQVHGVLRLPGRYDAEVRPVGSPQDRDVGVAADSVGVRRGGDAQRHLGAAVGVGEPAADRLADQPPVRRSGAEDRGLPTQHMDPQITLVGYLLDALTTRGGGGRPERVDPADPRRVERRQQLHRREPAQRPRGRGATVRRLALPPDHEDGIAHGQVASDSLDVHRRGADGDPLRHPCPGGHRVPGRPGGQVGGRLVGLRQLAGPGQAAHAGAGRHRHPSGRAERVLERERQERGRGAAPAGLVADAPGKLDQRARIGAGPQVALVGDPLVVEGEHVEHLGPGVHEGHRRVVGLAGAEPLQLRLSGECGRHRRGERTGGADPALQRRVARCVVRDHRGRRRAERQASAVVAVVAGHRPPATSTVRTPRSGTSGSLASWAISRSWTRSTPDASSPRPSSPYLWKRVARTVVTPGTASTAA